jgi:hypothetical protein
MARLGALALCVGLALSAAASARAADERPVVLFNGTDLTGWKLRGPEARSKWVVGRVALDPKDSRKFAVTPINPAASGGPATRVLINAAAGVDLYTVQKFGDCRLELEVMVPKGSNSGIYVMGEYEVQVLDSFGRKKVGPGDMGGIYATAAPRVNACKAPGEWQSFVIDFQAPRFKDGKKVANAKFLKVTLNGQVIHENVEAKGPTPSCLTGKESPAGPVLLQGDHGPVAFRNLKVFPRAAKE